MTGCFLQFDETVRFSFAFHSGVDDKIAEMKRISAEQDDKIDYYRSQIKVRSYFVDS